MPSFLNNLVQNEIIPAPVVAFNISRENSQFNSTVILGGGGYGQMGPNKFNLTFFNLSVPLVQSSGNRYSKGIKIIEYRWIPFFKPDEEFIATMALLEFDLGYISVP